MCILILRVAVAKILSVASSLHACRERVGGVRDRRRAEYEEVIEEYEEEILVQEKAPQPPTTDIADNPLVQGRPRCITLILIITGYIYVHLRYMIYIETTCIDKPTYESY